MEKISDFLKELRERLSSPLISSFLIAWLVANWRIVVGLVFYKIKDLNLDGYKSYFDLIEKNISLTNNLIWPLAIALFYTFIFPFLRNIIQAFGVWINKWGVDWTLKIQKDGSIGVEKYIQLRSKYKSLNENLIKVISDESLTNQENVTLNHQLQIIKSEKNDIKDMLDKYTNYNSLSILYGEWKYKTYQYGNVTLEVEDFSLGDKIEINNQSLFFLKNNKPVDTYNIQYYLSNLNMLVIIMSPPTATGNWKTLQFNINNNWNYLKGRDGSGNIFELERIVKKQ
ncbi:hypothetical protein [Mucilaginibacter gotjawali]|uniref:Uncharacterized protein n=2 Tax=Mucilaginibacter gotjawali TaxID=1550579 RepID=A0A120MZ45_9SPHI|nr:hypothetical protein [Mucilaginibacter gotjawali]MBB3057597.1 hypothetical protein [Mucilaginibacter gotjawali]BAU55258.1 hypothetical protein MgSA37_03439 [Mucilaginibacter gotjawali]